jgi:hypothetical protein
MRLFHTRRRPAIGGRERLAEGVVEGHHQREAAEHRSRRESVVPAQMALRNELTDDGEPLGDVVDRQRRE